MRVFFVSPHPDDETLGCAGTILKHKNDGHEIYWHILTTISKNDSYFHNRKKEIEKVKKIYRFNHVIHEEFVTGELDKYAKKDIIKKIEEVIKKIKPEIIYLPYEYDFHTDHKIVFECYKPIFKTFRYSFIKIIKQYEVLSETNLASIKNKNFFPNNYIDVSKYIKKKIEIMKIYKSEIGKFPFSRSKEAIIALAMYRGTQINLKFAESFIIVRQIEK
jgi:LmbE family N-acetylglucosaminyl deacetylase